MWCFWVGDFFYTSRYYYGLKIEVRGRKWKLTAILVLSYMTAYCLGSHGNFIILLVVCSPTKNRRKNQQLLQLYYYCYVPHKLNQSTTTIYLCFTLLSHHFTLLTILHCTTNYVNSYTCIFFSLFLSKICFEKKSKFCFWIRFTTSQGSGTYRLYSCQGFRTIFFSIIKSDQPVNMEVGYLRTIKTVFTLTKFSKCWLN